jgi:hypothetical protein
MKRTIISCALLFFLVSAITALFPDSTLFAEELAYKTVPDNTDWSNVRKGEYYIRFIARYANLRKDKEKNKLWSALVELLKGKEHPKALVIASAGYKGSKEDVQAGRILLSLNPENEEYDDSLISYNKPLLPPMRVSNFNQLNLVIDIKQSTVREPAMFAKILNTATSVPMLNEAAMGKLSLATDLLNVITAAIPEEKGHRLVADIDIETRDKLFATKRIVVFPSSELGEIEALNGNYPESKADFTADQLENYPSMIVIDVEKRRRLVEDAKTLFNETNPLAEDLEAMTKALEKFTNNEEKLNYCKNIMRPYIENTLGLNTEDSAIAVVMTMWRGGFDPDKTGAHLRIPGCFDHNDLELARLCGGNPGSCTSTDCKATFNFMQRWAAFSELSGVLAEKVRVRSNLGENSENYNLTAEEFVDQFECEGTYRNYQGTPLGGEYNAYLYHNNERVSAHICIFFKNVLECRKSPGIDVDHCKITRLIFSKQE